MNSKEISDHLEDLTDRQKAGCLHYLLGAMPGNRHFLETLSAAIEDELATVKYLREQKKKAKDFKL